MLLDLSTRHLFLCRSVALRHWRARAVFAEGADAARFEQMEKEHDLLRVQAYNASHFGKEALSYPPLRVPHHSSGD